jgi:seryl-tRNA synthetase
LLSIDLIRNDPERVRRSLGDRGDDVDIDRVLELDQRRRSVLTEVESLRARRKKVSREIGRLKEKPQGLIQEMREVGARIKELDEDGRTVRQELDGLLLMIPNIPDADVPLGADEDENVVMRTAEDVPVFDFEPLPHWELGESLGIIDLERGAKLSGSRFYVLKGKGATLQRALISWMLDVHVREHGYEELYLPYMVARKAALDSGQLPKFTDNMYHDDEDDLWLIPTAEVPITGLHSNEILGPGELPFHYVAHTPSFRREKAAAGRDTRGIKRVHQFEKVEMYKFVEPGDSPAELESMLADAEDLCARLEIPHRVRLLCTGDLGFAAVKTYDVEMWAPGCDEWLEVSSVSNCEDFQARRAGIRYRPEPQAPVRFVHTLNGSGLGVPRTIIAILENGQQADGSVVVPEVLRPYTGFERIDQES